MCLTARACLFVILLKSPCNRILFSAINNFRSYDDANHREDQLLIVPILANFPLWKYLGFRANSSSVKIIINFITL